jgi:hypothetical protein
MEQLIKVLVLLTILFLVWQIQKQNYIDRSVETFVNQFYSEHHPTNIISNGERCYNKLYKEDDKYYLVNTRRPIVLKKNPREFKTYNEYLHFAKIHKEKHGCPIIDITKPKRKIKKSLKLKDDPLETYEKRCNRKVSMNRYKTDNQLHYGEGHGYGQKLLKVNNKKGNFDDKESYDYHENFDVESCMKDLYLSEHDGIQASPL